ncbi:hypothetical protein V1514DRAFT_169777 [Lipomyces japonicus]|uniref:uncharacterized protein n=1 Tax=Lipomyces japonicus TaxID=56871 RepID=UPI0034CD0D72
MYLGFLLAFIFPYVALSHPLLFSRTNSGESGYLPDDSSSSSTLTIGSSNATSEFTNAYKIQIQGQTANSYMAYTAYINPLTVEASRTDEANVTYQGKLVEFVANSSVLLDSDSIAYISCDNSLSASVAVIQAANFNPACILLFSITAQTCNFTHSYRLYNGDIGAVFSTLSSYVGRQILSTLHNDQSGLNASVLVNQTNIFDSVETATGTPGFIATSTIGTAASQTPGVVTTTEFFDHHTSTPTSSSTASANANAASPSSGGSSSAMAMIVLYSVTGLISGFFLLIIILGAIRAHRHPERYQMTTSADGSTQRTNRARGLAKAVLDSIPLVKVPQLRADSRPGFPSAMPSASIGGRHNKGSQIGLDPNGEEVSRQVTVSTDQDSSSIDSKELMAAGTVETAETITETNDNHGPFPSTQMFPMESCPICFESFQPGQELRLLPCHHGFHAACVDPWLLTTSSQCPLCRVDLNLQIGEAIPDTPPGSAEASHRSHDPTIIPQHVEESALSFRLNRILDTWNAQLLPREERRIALERLREEDILRQEARRGRREQSQGEQTGEQTTWRRFVEMRRRIFHAQQQRQQQHEQDQDHTENDNIPNQGLQEHESTSSSTSPGTH